MLSENKRLKRELARLQNTDAEFQEFRTAFEDYSEIKEEKKEKERCPVCTRGKLVLISIPGNRQVRTCKICGHRELNEL